MREELPFNAETAVTAESWGHYGAEDQRVGAGLFFLLFKPQKNGAAGRTELLLSRECSRLCGLCGLCVDKQLRPQAYRVTNEG